VTSAVLPSGKLLKLARMRDIGLSPGKSRYISVCPGLPYPCFRRALLRFYSQEGNYDLVGNNIPIFFIQDSIQFPDLVHAVKPDPVREIPQAQTAHDNAWDFMGLNDASAAMMCWIMSDRTIPRSFRHIPGFGVHTWALINAEVRSPDLPAIEYESLPYFAFSILSNRASDHS